MNVVPNVVFAEPIRTVAPFQYDVSEEHFTNAPTGQERAHSSPPRRMSTREPKPLSSVLSPYLRDRPDDIPIALRHNLILELHSQFLYNIYRQLIYISSH